ncbi:MAG: DUF4198 domain-containing protein [Planctomycetota bacterium]
MRLPSRSLLLSTLALLALPLPALAHDFWVEAAPATADAGALVRLHLRVGEAYEGEPVTRNAERIERFALVTADGDVPIVGQEGADPAGLLRPTDAGLHLVVYRSRRTSIELPAAKFEAYLREEGLDAVIAARKAAGTSAMPGREVYSRCAKSMFRTRGPAAAGPRGPEPRFDHATGLRLELIPDADPTTSAGRGALPLRLHLDGAALAGALVVARPKADPSAERRARTDAEGRVRLELDRPGPWLVTSVHMLAAPKDTGADWESLWASLTFEVPAPPAPK